MRGRDPAEAGRAGARRPGLGGCTSRWTRTSPRLLGKTRRARKPRGGGCGHARRPRLRRDGVLAGCAAAHAGQGARRPFTTSRADARRARSREAARRPASALPARNGGRGERRRGPARRGFRRPPPRGPRRPATTTAAAPPEPPGGSSGGFTPEGTPDREYSPALVDSRGRRSPNTSPSWTRRRMQSAFGRARAAASAMFNGSRTPGRRRDRARRSRTRPSKGPSAGDTGDAGDAGDAGDDTASRALAEKMMGANDGAEVALAGEAALEGAGDGGTTSSARASRRLQPRAHGVRLEQVQPDALRPPQPAAEGPVQGCSTCSTPT